ncbi:MAG: serine/threonine-protein kinase [Verrucomicrobiota bacterium JB023]|nr:serine/threonine-protein kinase [Verrucomicrobiota bacterium JB023]
MSELAKCGNCEAVMDVTAAAPFARVRCPNCDTEVRVKIDFGPYLLDRRHAFGGMSVVFVARDQTLGREVALKVLNEEYSGDETRAAQFEKEAELTALVSHPNVVRVYTVGRAHGRFYIAMELVNGESLEKRMESGEPLPEKEILKIAIQVVEGLQAAKQSGLIHRDIKPGNILVNGKGTVKLVDFGLSLVTQGGRAKAEEVFATPYYASPEALGATEEDFRSDMYALGASLYHALAGKPPISTSSTGTKVLREAKQQVLPLRKMAPHVSEATGYAVDRAMAFLPAERFGSYEDMKAALRDALEGRAPADAPLLQSRRQRRKGNGMTIAVACVLAFAILSGGLVLALRDKQEVAEEPEPSALPPTQQSAELAIGQRYQDARKLLAEGHFNASEEAFSAIWKSTGVPEPTASWACFEAGVAAGLDGRSADARAHFRRLGRHAGKVGLESQLRQGFTELAQGWNGLPFIELPPNPPESSTGSLFYFAKALKNWEQGDRQAAEALAALAAQESTGRESASLAIYRQWAGRIARDAERLEEAEPDWQRDWTVDGISESLAGLDDLLKKLDSAGRARFIVRSWQSWLHATRRGLEEELINDEG